MYRYAIQVLRNVLACCSNLTLCTDMPTKNLSDMYRRMPVPPFSSYVSFIAYPLKIWAGMMAKIPRIYGHLPSLPFLYFVRI